MKFEWCTADHCGGILYGPYSRKYAFQIQKICREQDVCDRQDVFLILNTGKKNIRLIRFKCKGVINA